MTSKHEQVKQAPVPLYREIFVEINREPCNECRQQATHHHTCDRLNYIPRG